MKQSMCFIIHKIHLVLACLACVGHTRRVQSPGSVKNKLAANEAWARMAGLASYSDDSVHTGMFEQSREPVKKSKGLHNSDYGRHYGNWDAPAYGDTYRNLDALDYGGYLQEAQVAKKAKGKVKGYPSTHGQVAEDLYDLSRSPSKYELDSHTLASYRQQVAKAAAAQKASTAGRQEKRSQRNQEKMPSVDSFSSRDHSRWYGDWDDPRYDTEGYATAKKVPRAGGRSKAEGRYAESRHEHGHGRQVPAAVGGHPSQYEHILDQLHEYGHIPPKYNQHSYTSGGQRHDSAKTALEQMTRFERQDRRSPRSQKEEPYANSLSNRHHSRWYGDWDAPGFDVDRNSVDESASLGGDASVYRQKQMRAFRESEKAYGRLDEVSPGLTSRKHRPEKTAMPKMSAVAQPSVLSQKNHGAESLLDAFRASGKTLGKEEAVVHNTGRASQSRGSAKTPGFDDYRHFAEQAALSAKEPLQSRNSMAGHRDARSQHSMNRQEQDKKVMPNPSMPKRPVANSPRETIRAMDGSFRDGHHNGIRSRDSIRSEELDKKVLPSPRLPKHPVVNSREEAVTATDAFVQDGHRRNAKGGGGVQGEEQGKQVLPTSYTPKRPLTNSQKEVKANDAIKSRDHGYSHADIEQRTPGAATQSRPAASSQKHAHARSILDALAGGQQQVMGQAATPTPKASAPSSNHFAQNQKSSNDLDEYLRGTPCPQYQPLQMSDWQEIDRELALDIMLPEVKHQDIEAWLSTDGRTVNVKGRRALPGGRKACLPRHSQLSADGRFEVLSAALHLPATGDISKVDVKELPGGMRIVLPRLLPPPIQETRKKTSVPLPPSTGIYIEEEDFPWPEKDDDACDGFVDNRGDFQSY
jgi:hypothetical protein